MISVPQVCETKHGLKFAIGNAYLLMTPLHDRASEEFRLFSRILECAEGLPLLFGYVTFAILLALGSMQWYYCVLIGLAAQLFGVILSHAAWFFKMRVFEPIMVLWTNVIARFFLHIIAIVVIGIIVKVWYAPLVFVAASFLLRMLLMNGTESMQGRLAFNEKIAEYVTHR